MSPEVISSPRIRSVDGLRGVAVMLVLLSHFVEQQLGRNPGSWQAYLGASLGLSFSGVDLFFVISGFLISGILMDNRTATNYAQVFYLRRSLRIIPLYYLFLLVCWTLPGLADGVLHPSYPLFGYLTFICNGWMGVHGWDQAWPALAWSLAVEEQFYLFFPLIVRFCPPGLLLKTTLAAIVIAPLLRVGLLHLAPSWWLGTHVFGPSRMDSLAFGVLISLACRRADLRAWLDRHPRFPLLVALALCPVLANLTLKRVTVGSFAMSAYGYSALGLFYASLLLAVIRQPTRWLARLCESRMLVFIGGVSYFVYLFQGIVAWAVFRLFGRPGLSLKDPVDAALIALTLLALGGLGFLSGKLFESPLLAWGRRHQYAIARASDPLHARL